VPRVCLVMGDSSDPSAVSMWVVAGAAAGSRSRDARRLRWVREC